MNHIKYKNVTTIITVIITIITCGGIFYFYNQKVEKEQTKLKNQDLDIQEQINNPTNKDRTTQISSSTILTTSEEISSGKKIYSNHNLRYSIEYPVDWTLDDQYIDDGTLFLFSEQRKNDIDVGKMIRTFNIFVKVYKSSIELPTNDRRLNFEDWIKQEVDSNFIKKKESIVIDGVSGYQVIFSSDGDFYSIYIQKGSQIYEIGTGDPVKSMETYKPTETEQKIINSFKFI